MPAKLCPLCKKHPLRKATTFHKVRVGAETVSVELPSMRCVEDGDLVEHNDLHLANLLVADAVIRSGLRTGDALRFLRHVLGLRANELAERLDTTPEQISRWERGKRKIDSMTWMVVAWLLVGQITREENRIEKAAKRDPVSILDALRKPKPLPRRINLAS